MNLKPLLLSALLAMAGAFTASCQLLDEGTYDLGDVFFSRTYVEKQKARFEGTVRPVLQAFWKQAIDEADAESKTAAAKIVELFKAASDNLTTRLFAILGNASTMAPDEANKYLAAQLELLNLETQRFAQGMKAAPSGRSEPLPTVTLGIRGELVGDLGGAVAQR